MPPPEQDHRVRRRHGRLRFTLVAAILLATAAVPARAGADRSFSVLSYNVHGVFRLAAKHPPRKHSRTIGWLASRYDVVLLQEDFEYHRMIKEEMAGRRIFRGNGMRLDPRLVVAKALLFPARILLPHFSAPYGAGLTTFADPAFVSDPEVVRRRYDRCAGWVRSRGDCFASKGFLRVRLHTPGGGEIDVYNTHLDAGPDAAALAVRRRQLDQLATGIERLSAGRAVIVAGDFNCDPGRPGDPEALAGFRQRVGLSDSGAGPDLPFWRERDYILYRDGETTRLAVEAFGEALEFVNRDRALSDHPAVYARFRASTVP